MADIKPETKPVLTVDNLSVDFGSARVVRSLSFALNRNRTLAIVGESGSGKSVSSLAILGLVGHLGGHVAEGQILFQSDISDAPVDLTQLDPTALQAIRGNEIAMIFQEPMSSLNPVFTIGAQIVETLTLHRGQSVRAARAQAERLLDQVRLPNARRLLDSYPHQLSGGMRQRAMIAMALSCQPKVLIADEPTTALDVTVQAQILHIIRELQNDLETAVIFISHDLGVVSQMADDVLVMNKGQTVEHGPADQIFLTPQADYTRMLLSSVPQIGAMKDAPRPMPFDIPGQPQSQSQSQEITQMPSAPLISVRNLTTRFDIRGGLLNGVTHRVHAAENISFDIHAGETFALVGESGSGKSTVGRTIQQLVEPAAGHINFLGKNLFALPEAERQPFKRHVQYVFQDPYGSLNPRKRVGDSIIEPALTHGLVASGSEARQRVADLLTDVGLEPAHATRFPHEFSGGQRQRICIARALSCDPSLIIADEAVSALDVSVQARVINLLMRLQAQRQLAYLFISHDMAVVERISHRLAVMYAGQIVEIGTRQQIFETPQHAYTKRLLDAVPIVDPHQRPAKPELSTEVPSPIRRVGDTPALNQYAEVADGHFVAVSTQAA